MEHELEGLDNRELFIILTEGRDVVLRAKLQNILREHLRFYGKDSFSEEEDNVDLQAIVKEYYEGRYTQ